VRKLKNIESWLGGRVDQTALCILASALFLYVYYGTGSYLNPDEAGHIVTVNRGNVYGAYAASHSSAHPPLMFVVLHILSGFGQSVLFLRFLSAALSVVASWLVFKWIKRAFGPVEGIAGLMFLTFSPGMISIACEVRQYAMLLFFVSGALYFLQRFIEEGSLWTGVPFSAFLYGAILTHYSAILVALAFAVYVATVFLRKPPGWRSVWLWLVSQSGVVILYGLLYITHIRWMHSTGFAEAQIQGYLKPEYFLPGQETIISFLARSTLDVFSYIAGGETAGIMVLACLLLGIIGNVANPYSNLQVKSGRHYSILLILPFVIGSIGAIARVLPFGGSRHISYLLPFIAAGVGVCVVRVFSMKKLTLCLAAGMIILPVWLVKWQPPNADPRMSDAHMKAALEQLNERVPANSLLFVDDMTHYVLAYYLTDDQVRRRGREGRMGKYHVVWAKPFAFSPDNFERELVAMSRSLNIRSGDFVWVMTVGWYSFDSFSSFLSLYLPDRIKERWNFGSIILMQILVL